MIRLEQAAALAAAALCIALPIAAQDPEYTELAKDISNPVASLVSVPFQLNWEFGAAHESPRVVLNVQPVMPFSLGSSWNLIARVIAPLIHQPAPFDGAQSASGLGDLITSLFLSPKRPGALIWGVGPALGLPMSTNPLLGTGKWSAGPTVLGLIEPDPWTIGILANHLWSYAGEDERV